MAHQNQFAFELSQKDKLIGELEQQMHLEQRQAAGIQEKLEGEIEQMKEQAMQMRKNEAIIDVYKNKLDGMAEMKQELTESQELVTKLYADIEMLNQELTRTRALEECVNNLTDELNKARDRDVKKDLLV